jgi:hypothetical protein
MRNYLLLDLNLHPRAVALAPHRGARRRPKLSLTCVCPLPPLPEASPGKARGVATVDFLDRHGEVAAAPAPAICGPGLGREDSQGASIVGGDGVVGGVGSPM